MNKCTIGDGYHEGHRQWEYVTLHGRLSFDLDPLLEVSFVAPATKLASS